MSTDRPEWAGYRILEVSHGDGRAADRLVRQGVEAGEWEPNVVAPAVAVDAATGDVVLIAARYEGDLTALRQAFLRYPMSTTRRSVGIRNRSGVFGNVARRVHMKREGCRACNGSAEDPRGHATIVGAADPIFETFRRLHPEQAAADLERAAVFLPEWRMGASPWTSGVLNESSPLPYHYDRNNLPGVWSGMLVARRGMDGGHLHVPVWGLVVDCRDGDVVYFPASGTVHGVTPMRRRQADGYRYTAVFYAVAGIKDCLTAKEEHARAQRERSAREDVLLQRQANEGLLSR